MVFTSDCIIRRSACLQCVPLIVQIVNVEVPGPADYKESMVVFSSFRFLRWILQWCCDGWLINLLAFGQGSDCASLSARSC